MIKVIIENFKGHHLSVELYPEESIYWK